MKSTKKNVSKRDSTHEKQGCCQPPVKRDHEKSARHQANIREFWDSLGAGVWLHGEHKKTGKSTFCLLELKIKTQTGTETPPLA